MSISDKSVNIHLDANELDNVIGGVSAGGQRIIAASGNADTITAFCPQCNQDREFKQGSGGRAYCMVCNYQIMK